MNITTEKASNPRRFEIDVNDFSTLMVHVKGGTVSATGVALSYEASLDSASKETGTWFPIGGVRTITPGTLDTAIGPFGLAPGIGQAFATVFNVAAIKRFRVNVTAITAGDITITIARSKAPSDIIYSAAPLATQPVSGTVAATNAILASTAAGGYKAEDAAHVSGDVGVQMLGVRNPATPAIPTSAAGDYGAILIDSEGKSIVSGTGAPEQTGRAMVATNAQTPVAALAAPGAGLRWYITAIAIAGAGAAGVATIIQSAASGVWRANPGTTQSFPTPIQCGVNEAVNVQLETGAVNVWVCVLAYKGV